MAGLLTLSVSFRQMHNKDKELAMLPDCKTFFRASVPGSNRFDYSRIMVLIAALDHMNSFNYTDADLLH